MTKCLVLLSGGQDSTTCLAWASANFKEAHAVSFDYGQKHKIELTCADKIAKIAKVKSYDCIPIKSIAHLGNSSLIGGSSIDITNSPHPTNPKLPASFVPGRNYIFLGLAAARAYQLGIHHIITGVCQTDYSGYPDCRDTTIKSIQTSLQLALDYPLSIHTPLMWKTKAETVLLMEKLGKLSWLGFSHTCYNGKRPPCGECPACKLRQAGFDEVGVRDPLEKDF